MNRDQQRARPEGLRVDIGYVFLCAPSAPLFCKGASSDLYQADKFNPNR
jgi:hypothetical protein